MAKLKHIEERTHRFVEIYNELKEAGKLPSNVELSKLLGISSKSGLSEILAKRQNIQPDTWHKFKTKFGVSDNPEISVSRESVPIEKKLSTMAALLDVLLGEVASQKAEKTGEPVQLIIERIRSAAEEVSKLHGPLEAIVK